MGMSATILIVEDEGIIAEDIQATLGRLGYTVPKTASSSKEAIRLAQELRPNLALMDIKLKGDTDGIETAQVLRQRFDIPVVYLTSFSDAATLARAKDTVPLGFLVKPFSQSELRATIEIALHKHELESKPAERLACLATLTAGIAHEINDPLAHVISNLDFAREVLVHGSDRVDQSELSEALKTAHGAAARMRQIVVDMMKLARGDAIEPCETDLGGAIEAAIRVSEPVLRDRARVVKMYSSTPKVAGNPGQLAQVFANLIVNAARASDADERGQRGGEIIIRTRTDASGDAIVEVQDSGPGIRPSDLPRVFDPFFATEPPGVGLGLGLEISRIIARSLGGDIAVESVLGEGATFRVRLPASSSSRIRSKA
jgi:signal transduction histidine kinase